MPHARGSLVATLLLVLTGCTSAGTQSGSEADGQKTVQVAARASGQSGSLRMHPPIAQPGVRAARASRAKSAMTATFVPAVHRRPVTVQRKDGRRWVDVTTAREDGKGRVELAARTEVNGRAATYRMVAGRYRGRRAVATDPVRTDVWGPADFSDQFSATPLGQDWSQRLQGYSKESKRKCSKADPSAVRLRQGTVRLSVLEDPDRTGTKCRYEGDRYSWRLNGAIDTQGNQSFRYGYAAARIKFQPRRGQHASFWMQPQTRAADEGSARDTGAEMDVIEWFGGDHPQGGLASFIYYYPDNGGAGVTAKKVGGYLRKPGRFGHDWADKYHVFAVEWTPQRYVFRIDGKETFRTSQGVSGQPQYLILSLLSSDYELKQLDGDRHLPQTMSVDWVRFWQR